MSYILLQNYVCAAVRMAQFYFATLFWNTDQFAAYYLVSILLQVHDALKTDGVRELYYSEKEDPHKLWGLKLKIDLLRSVLEASILATFYFAQNGNKSLIILGVIYLLLDYKTPARTMKILREQRYRLFASIEISSAFFVFFTTSIVAYSGKDISWIVLGFFFRPIFLQFISGRLGEQKLSAETCEYFSLLKSVSRHIGFYFATTLLFVFSSRLDKYIIDVFTTRAAEFFFAYSVCHIAINLLGKSVSSFFLAKFSRSTTSRVGLRQLYQTSIFLFSATILLQLWFADVEELLYGGKWSGALDFILPISLFFLLRGLTLESPFVAARRFDLRLINEVVFVFSLVALLLLVWWKAVPLGLSEYFAYSYPLAALVAWIYWVFVFRKVYFRKDLDSV